MDQELQVPEGYCPNCEYPINPGTCPECGAIVAPEALSKSPASARRRKIRRRMFIFVPLLSLAILSFIVYRAVNWIALAPTGVLFAFQEGFDGPVGRELFIRFRDGTLSPLQTQELIDPYVDDPIIEGFSRYPAEVDFKLLVRCQARLPSSGWILAMESWQLSIDGEHVDSSDRRLLQEYEEGPTGDESIWCPPQSEGRHRIIIDGVATLKVSTPSGASAVLHRRRVHLSRDVEITGAFGDYVRAERSPDLVEQFNQSVAAVAFLDPDISQDTIIAILYGQLKVPIAGTVLVRAPGDVRGFIPLREVVMSGAGARFLHLDPKLHLDRAGSLDVLINPDPLVAFHGGVRHYLGGAIRWQRLPIRSDVQVRIPLALNQASVPPTNIVLNGPSAEE